MGLFFAGAPTLVTAIQRGQRWIVPHGGEEIRAGDIAYFAIARADLANVVALVRGEGDGERAAQGPPRVMIAGATRIGLDLARRLAAQEQPVVLVEEDRALARAAAEGLDRALVLHGRPMDQSLLEEEEIEGVSAFVAVTPDFENNLVSALLARRLGAGRTFALVDHPDLVHLIGEIAIDSIISPRLLAVSLALQHVRGGAVRSVATLLEDQVEVIEAEAVPGSPITSRSLAELGLPRGALVAALRRDERIVVPRGGTRVEPGDRFVVISTTEVVPRVAQLLSPS
jgi:trk system potassium uptake protein TrkA